MNYLNRVGDDRELKTGSLSETWSKEGNHHLNSQMNVQAKAFPLHPSNSLHFSFISFKNFIHIFVLCMGLCVPVWICATQGINMHESVLTSHHMGPGTELWLPGLAVSPLTNWAILPAPTSPFQRKPNIIKFDPQYLTKPSQCHYIPLLQSRCSCLACGILHEKQNTGIQKDSKGFKFPH